MSNKNQVQLSQRDMFDLLTEMIALKGKCTYDKSGTYNVADPTHFHNRTFQLGMEMGFTVSEDETTESHPQDSGYPLPEVVTVEINDCTWCETIRINTSKENLEVTFDGKEWLNINCEFNDFVHVLTRLALEGSHPDKMNTECIEDGYGSLSQYE